MHETANSSLTTSSRIAALLTAAFLLSAWAQAALAGLGPDPAQPSSPLIREEQTVRNGDVAETWRLVWHHAPQAVCSPEEGHDTWGMCPCDGFAFAEEGEMALVRLVPGQPPERLELTPYFLETPGNDGKAVVQRWAPARGDEAQDNAGRLARQVRQRKPVSIMRMGDYDHDGRATEFVLQIGAGPCGHRQSVLVGLDGRNRQLHVLGTAENPGEPLVMEHPEAWERIRTATGEVSIMQWPCGDHFGEEEERLEIRVDGAGLHATSVTSPCPDAEPAPAEPDRQRP